MTVGWPPPSIGYKRTWLPDGHVANAPSGDGSIHWQDLSQARSVGPHDTRADLRSEQHMPIVRAPDRQDGVVREAARQDLLRPSGDVDRGYVPARVRRRVVDLVVDLVGDRPAIV
jgi:hypothetical protein